MDDGMNKKLLPNLNEKLYDVKVLQPINVLQVVGSTLPHGACDCGHQGHVCLVPLGRGLVLDHLDQLFEAAVHPDQVAALVFLSQPEDGVGAEHLQLDAVC